MHDPLQAFRAAILAALGHAPPDVIEPGRFYRFSTSDRHGNDVGWCKLFEDMGGGVLGCYRQGISETWRRNDHHTMTFADRRVLARRVMAAAAKRAHNESFKQREHARRNAKMLAQCVAPTLGDPVAGYLRQRGLAEAWPLPPAIKLHPGLDCWNDGAKLGSFPAMVAAIQAPAGHVVALHRTYLSANGRKADVPVVKKLTGAAGALSGACIRLHLPARGMLGVAEGIETALAASLASGVPTVAAYCAGALAGFLWPAGVRRLVIFADNDKAGRESAAELQSRAVRSGLAVNVMTPTDDGADWCDVWAARGAIEVTG